MRRSNPAPHPHAPEPNASASEHACHECGGPVTLDSRHAEWVCQTCGLVEDAALSVAHTTGLHNDRPTLAIPRTALPGAKLGGQATRPTRTADRVPESLARARRELNRLADVLAIPPPVALEAFRRYERLHQAGKTQGRRLNATVGACLVDATRDRGVPRSTRAIADAAQVRPADIGRALRALADQQGHRVMPSQPERFLWALASRADLPPFVVAEATQALARLPAAARTGRRPEPLAAAALVLACRRLEVRHNLAELAREAGVSRQAIHQTVNHLDSELAASTHINDFAQVTGERASTSTR